MVKPSTVEVRQLTPQVPRQRSIQFMGLVKKVVKAAIAAKVIQVAARELQKPENQAKIREGLNKLNRTVRSR